jgi:AcrR family transcriptional regulator
MRLSRGDWLAHGLRILTEQGPEELKVDRLCVHLGVTKGSFYHHFADRQAFVEALLAYWEEQNTDRMIRAAEQVAPGQRGPLLSTLVRRADQAPEVALRAWARHEAAVARFVESVDRKRIDYLAKLIRAGSKRGTGAKLAAKLLYAHLVGVQQLGSLITAREWQQMDELLGQWLEESAGYR